MVYIGIAVAQIIIAHYFNHRGDASAPAAADGSVQGTRGVKPTGIGLHDFGYAGTSFVGFYGPLFVAYGPQHYAWMVAIAHHQTAQIIHNLVGSTHQAVFIQD